MSDAVTMAAGPPELAADGTLRRNPEHRFRDASHLGGLQALQARLLDAAARCVRPGGCVTYSVCTPLLAECEAVVGAFLERHADFDALPIDEPRLQPFVAHARALGGERRCLRTWTHRHEACDSFFAAKLRRRAPAAESPDV